MDKIDHRAEILIEALPYIRKLSGKTVVIKYGGSALIDTSLKETIIQDIVLMSYVGIRPVLVHGGGKHITEQMIKQGKTPRFLDGLRVTDKETLSISEMVLTGNINQDLVSRIQIHGGKSVGISGKDGQVLLARKKKEPFGWVGEIESVQVKLLEVLQKEGFLPVVSPIGMSENGETLNINADEVASSLAVTLKAPKLIFISDVRGLYSDPKDESTLIPSIDTKGLLKLKKEGKLKEGMIPKVQSCISAIENGIEKIHLIDGRLPHSILLELFTEKGIGTQILL